MNSYQKLKADNLILKEEIRILVFESESEKAVRIRSGYGIAADLERAIWSGERSKSPEEYQKHFNYFNGTTWEHKDQ